MRICNAVGIVFAGLCLAGPSAQSEEAAYILERAQQSAQRLNTMAVELHTKLSFVEKRSRLFFDGNLYRVEIGVHDDSNKKPDLVHAYDGEHHQIWIEASEQLIVSDAPRVQNLIGGQSPPIAPYYWLFDVDDTTQLWSDVRNARVWDRVREKAEFVERLEYDGHSLAVVEFQRRSPASYVKVAFAEDLDFFPLVTECRSLDDTPFTRAEVTRYRRVGDVVVALEVQITRTAEPQTEGTITVDEGTLRVNEPIDRELFTLSKARAKMFMDADELYARADELNNNQRLLKQEVTGHLVSNPTSRPWLVIASVILLGILVAAYATKSKRVRS
jgi:hypothetical protein